MPNFWLGTDWPTGIGKAEAGDTYFDSTRSAFWQRVEGGWKYVEAESAAKNLGLPPPDYVVFDNKFDDDYGKHTGPFMLR